MVPNDDTEARRLARLQMLGILDSAPEPIFDRLVRLAAQACGTRISLVTLVDRQRQWFKANIGLEEVAETPREVAFCHHAIQGDAVFEVPDAVLDSRFMHNPLVTGAPGIRFYAGAPIVMPGGERVGTLCVIDPAAGCLSEAQRATLCDLASIARDALLQREELQLARLQADQARFAAILEAAPVGLVQTDAEGNCIHVNPRWCEIFGLRGEDGLGRGWLARVHAEDRAATAAAWDEAVRWRTLFEREFRVPQQGGTWLQVRCVARPIPAGGAGRGGFVGTAVDVSVRARAEARLRDANRFLERAERISGVGGWELELPARRLKWTDQTRAIHELPPQHLPDPDDQIDYLESEERPRLRAAQARALAQGEAWDLVLRMKTARGRPIWVRSVGRAESEDGVPVRLVGTLQDVTEQRGREERLREANTLFQAVMDNLPCGLSVFDAQFRLIAHNAQFCALLDVPAELLAQGPDFERIALFIAQRGEYGPGDPRELARRRFAMARSPSGHNYQRVRPDGRTIEARGAPMPGGGVITTYVDVTESKAADAALRTSEERQQRALQASGLVLWDVDVAAGRLYIAGNGLGIASGEAGMDAFDTLVARVPAAQRPALEAAWLAALKGEAEDYDVEHQLLTDDGRLIWTHSRGQVTSRDANGRALRVSGTNTDITERRAAAAALLEAKEAAEAANRAKTEFVTTISHEIRTPLNGVLGITRLLLAQRMEPTHRRLIELLDTSGQALMGLVNDVLDFGKIEAGQLVLDSNAFDLRRLLEDLADLYSLRASAKGLRFRYAPDPGIPQGVRGDAHRLRQILNNLLSNALKFTEEGGFSLEVRPAVHGGAQSRVRFTVRDSGIGIAADAQPRLFERFVQADGSTTRRYGGTGLGLAITRELCQRMGGAITLHSEPGEGSRFEVELPLEMAELHEGAPASGFQELGAAPAGGTHALLVAEDNPTNQVVVQGLLAQAGWTDVVLVRDGEQALRAALDGSFAAVLMDCHMPVLDGFEATRRLRAKGVSIPIIAITAGVTDAERSKCLACGMDDVIAKPLDPKNLDRILRRWILPPAQAPARRFGGAALLFDRDGVLERFGGDQELLSAALGAYLDEWPALKARMAGALARGDAQQLRRELHSLAGSSAAVGAVQVAGIARQLQARVDGAVAPTAADLARLTQEVARFAQESEGLGSGG